MDIWGVRAQSLRLLETEFKRESGLILEAFGILDACLERYSMRLAESEPHRIVGLVVSKGRNLAQACYSLVLDGLGQEAGAVLRPLSEAFELLVYFKQDPTRVGEATSGRLPRAGEIAKRIDGRLLSLRRYLNESASHLELAAGATNHLIDFKAGTLRAGPALGAKVLWRNLRMVHGFLVLLAIEAVNCLQIMNPGSAEDLADAIEAHRGVSLQVFRYDEMST